MRYGNRRSFIRGIVAGSGALTLPGLLGQVSTNDPVSNTAVGPGRIIPPYQGPNVILIRFGGGVRRRETVDPQHTYAPYFCHDLIPKGVLFKNMEIDSLEGVETSHGQGTLYLISGKYDRFKDIENKFLAQRFESKVPTLFEYLRKSFQIPVHQALIINGEDRTDEEFYTFSNHHLFGASFRSQTLSLYRFKTHLLRRKIEGWSGSDKELEEMKAEWVKMESLDYRAVGQHEPMPEIEAFWDRWRSYYGDSGLVNPRGDRLLTELAMRAMNELRPRLMMINYNDPDYVHWGNMTHYTRGISIIDEGIKRLVAHAEHNEFYADNTVFVLVPDCGRDSNPFISVPCQHHFNSRSAHEIFALFFGKGIDKGRVIEGRTDQVSVAPTIAQLMGFKAEYAEGVILEPVFA